MHQPEFADWNGGGTCTFEDARAMMRPFPLPFLSDHCT